MDSMFGSGAQRPVRRKVLTSAPAGADILLDHPLAMDAEDRAEGMGFGGDDDGRGGKRAEDACRQAVRQGNCLHRDHSKALPKEA